MPSVRVITKICHIRGVRVSILQEGVHSPGQEIIVGWRNKVCLDRSKDCVDLTCRFTHFKDDGAGNEVEPLED